MKCCSKCPIELTPETGFFKNRGGGSSELKNLCRSCYRERERTRNRNNPEKSAAKHRRKYISWREWLDGLKQGRPCEDCGRVFPPECMDFDHTGNKLFTVSHMANRTRDLVLEEIKKCRLICANCHRIRTKRTWNELYAQRKTKQVCQKKLSNP